jgi:catechol 2,3-dioxygenase-like lactoylglutathione lyase family enzyme
VRVVGFDHIVVLASDAERSLAFYVDALGLAPVRVDEWRRGEVPFPSARVNDHTIIDIVGREHAGANVDHFCLVIEPTDLDAVVASGRFDIVDGPARRYGAQGNGTSLYVRDPDGNTVELRYY